MRKLLETENLPPAALAKLCGLLIDHYEHQGIACPFDWLEGEKERAERLAEVEAELAAQAGALTAEHKWSIPDDPEIPWVLLNLTGYYACNGAMRWAILLAHESRRMRSSHVW